MNKRIALVTNVLDYVGPPSVRALLQDGYKVVAQDSAFQNTKIQEDYEANNPGTSPLGVKDPEKLVDWVWKNNKKVR